MYFVMDIPLDCELSSHEERVYNLCKEFYSYVGVTYIESVWLDIASRNHDVGKHCIPDSILNVPRALNPEEREFVNKHSYFGYLMMKESGIREEICLLVLLHHGLDKFNGGVVVSNERIIWLADIIRICDIYDALVSERVYKKGMEKDKALEIILKEESLPGALKSKFIDFMNKSN